jgi:hypothetical protein
MKSLAALVCFSLTVLPVSAGARGLSREDRGVITAEALGRFLPTFEKTATGGTQIESQSARHVPVGSNANLNQPAPGKAAAPSDSSSGEPQRARRVRVVKHPFVLFAPMRWRPASPLPGGWQENLAYALFVAAPLVSFGLLLWFIRRGRRKQTPTGWGRLVVGNVLVFCCLATPLLLAGETYFRFFYDTTDSLGYTRVCERWELRHWRLNNVGVRDDVDYSPAIPPGKRRISFLGDSFTAGHGISNVENRFANLLRRAHPEWQIHTVARIGLDTGAELQLMKKAFKRGYQVDEVVLVYCLNDIEDLMPGQGAAMDRALAVLDYSPWIFRNSYMLNLFYDHYQALRDPYLGNYCFYVRRAYRGPLWQQQEARLKTLRDLVQAHGGHFAVVTFPFLNALGPHYEYQFVHDELDRFWRGLGVPHLDLLPIFKGLPPSKVTVNHFDAHPNEYADKLAAAAMDPWLQGLLATNSAVNLSSAPAGPAMTSIGPTQRRAQRTPAGGVGSSRP